jgi:competence protein ComEA
MAETPKPSDPSRQPRPRLTLRRADQVAAAICLALGLTFIGGWWLWQARLGQRLIDIEQAEPIAIDTRIDVNEANWPELALLPGIGEQLAKRIVADRDLNGPFRDADDLQRVRGIGPRTVERMQPFLLPMPDWEATVERGARTLPAPAVN